LTEQALDKEVSMSVALELSYQHLGAEAARAYRLLGLIPVPRFGMPLICAVLDLRKADAEELVGTLVSASLLEADDLGRYSFRDLVRLHVRRCAERDEEPETADAVLAVVLDHYLFRAADVYRTAVPQEWRLGPVYEQIEREPPPYESSAEALASLEPERANLMAALQAGVRNHHDELVWQLCEALWPLFLFGKHFTDWIQAYLWGVEAATRCGDAAACSRMHHRLGLAYNSLRRTDDAVEQGALALRAAREAGHRAAESDALFLIAIAHGTGGRHGDAVRIFRVLVEFDRREGLGRNEVLNRRRLGQALIAAGQLDEAITELIAGREQAAALDDPIVEAVTTVWLADARSRSGQSAEADNLLKEAASIILDYGSTQYTGLLRMVWGEVALCQGDHDTARTLLTQARDALAATSAPHLERVQVTLDRLDQTSQR
jgi:tetratricopeptide (TPR) repeat protein